MNFRVEQPDFERRHPNLVPKMARPPSLFAPSSSSGSTSNSANEAKVSKNAASLGLDFGPSASGPPARANPNMPSRRESSLVPLASLRRGPAAAGGTGPLPKEKDSGYEAI